VNEYDGATVVYHASRMGMLTYLRLFHRFQVIGSDHVPAEGGCVIAANHVSYFDPPAMACGVNHRIVHFMARNTLSSNRLAKWYFENIEAVSIDRTKGDLAALRKGIALLKEGRVLGMFPEGTRSPDGEMKTAKGGIGFLIAKGQVPVVPTYVSGTYKAFPKGASWPKPSRVGIHYGPPITVDEIAAIGTDRESYDRIGELVMSRIAALKPVST
jgi:1-acyl-sn-glycerol-3-phosphate acyltransferase